MRFLLVALLCALSYAQTGPAPCVTPLEWVSLNEDVTPEDCASSCNGASTYCEESHCLCKVSPNQPVYRLSAEIDQLDGLACNDIPMGRKMVEDECRIFSVAVGKNFEFDHENGDSESGCYQWVNAGNQFGLHEDEHPCFAESCYCYVEPTPTGETSTTWECDYNYDYIAGGSVINQLDYDFSHTFQEVIELCKDMCENQYQDCVRFFHQQHPSIHICNFHSDFVGTPTGHGSWPSSAVCTIEHVESIPSTFCLLPQTQYGYIMQPDAHLLNCSPGNCDEPTISGVSCDTSIYLGNSISLSAPACTGSNLEVTLTGCEPIRCVIPQGQLGYALSYSSYIDECTIIDCKTPIVTSVNCDASASYVQMGAISSIGCTAENRGAILTGCEPQGFQFFLLKDYLEHYACMGATGRSHGESLISIRCLESDFRWYWDFRAGQSSGQGPQNHLLRLMGTDLCVASESHDANEHTDAGGAILKICDSTDLNQNFARDTAERSDILPWFDDYAQSLGVAIVIRLAMGENREMEAVGCDNEPGKTFHFNNGPGPCYTFIEVPSDVLLQPQEPTISPSVETTTTPYEQFSAVGCYEYDADEWETTTYRIVEATFDGAHGCGTTCKEEGYRYFGFVCPSNAGVGCICKNTDVLAPRLVDKLCLSENFAVPDCSGPFTVSNGAIEYSLGSGDRGMVYWTNLWFSTMPPSVATSSQPTKMPVTTEPTKAPVTTEPTNVPSQTPSTGPSALPTSTSPSLSPFRSTHDSTLQRQFVYCGDLPSEAVFTGIVTDPVSSCVANCEGYEYFSITCDSCVCSNSLPTEQSECLTCRSQEAVGSLSWGKFLFGGIYKTNLIDPVQISPESFDWKCEGDMWTSSGHVSEIGSLWLEENECSIRECHTKFENSGIREAREYRCNVTCDQDQCQPVLLYESHNRTSLSKVIQPIPKFTSSHYIVAGDGETARADCQALRDWNGRVACDARAVPDSETHGVRCCSNNLALQDSTSIWIEKSCPDILVWDQKFLVDGNCVFSDFNGAQQICEDLGGRLCTLDEMLRGCLKGTGCNFDFRLQWTSTTGKSPFNVLDYVWSLSSGLQGWFSPEGSTFSTLDSGVQAIGMSEEQVRILRSPTWCGILSEISFDAQSNIVTNNPHDPSFVGVVLIGESGDVIRRFAGTGFISWDLENLEGCVFMEIRAGAADEAICVNDVSVYYTEFLEVPETCWIYGMGRTFDAIVNTTASTARECERSCSSTLSCQFWTWNRDDLSCALRDVEGLSPGTSPGQGLISGRKMCGGQNYVDAASVTVSTDCSEYPVEYLSNGLMTRHLLHAEASQSCNDEFTNYTLIGCWNRKDGNSLLQEVAQLEGNIIEKCSTVCRNYPLFGVEDSFCYCGGEGLWAEAGLNTECVNGRGLFEVATDVYARTWTYALRFYGHPATNPSYRVDVSSILESGTYVLSLWVKRDDSFYYSSLGSHVIARFGAGSDGESTNQFSFTLPVPSRWTYHEFKFETSVTHSKLDLYFGWEGTSDGNLWVTDLRLVDPTGNNLISNGDFASGENLQQSSTDISADTMLSIEMDYPDPTPDENQILTVNTRLTQPLFVSHVEVFSQCSWYESGPTLPVTIQAAGKECGVVNFDRWCTSRIVLCDGVAADSVQLIAADVVRVVSEVRVFGTPQEEAELLFQSSDDASVDSYGRRVNAGIASTQEMQLEGDYLAKFEIGSESLRRRALQDSLVAIGIVTEGFNHEHSIGYDEFSWALWSDGVAIHAGVQVPVLNAAFLEDDPDVNMRILVRMDGEVWVFWEVNGEWIKGDEPVFTNVQVPFSIAVQVEPGGSWVELKEFAVSSSVTTEVKLQWEATLSEDTLLSSASSLMTFQDSVTFCESKEKKTLASEGEVPLLINMWQTDTNSTAWLNSTNDEVQHLVLLAYAYQSIPSRTEYTSNLNFLRHCFCSSPADFALAVKTTTGMLNNLNVEYHFDFSSRGYHRIPLIFFGPVADVYANHVTPQMRDVTMGSADYILVRPSCAAETINSAISSEDVEDFDILSIPSKLQYVQDNEVKIMSETHVTSSNAKCKNYDWVAFPKPFSSDSVVVIVTLQSSYSEVFVTPRVQGITRDGFYVTLQAESAESCDDLQPEYIGWIAATSGTYVIGTSLLEFGTAEIREQAFLDLPKEHELEHVKVFASFSSDHTDDYSLLSIEGYGYESRATINRRDPCNTLLNESQALSYMILGSSLKQMAPTPSPTLEDPPRREQGEQEFKVEDSSSSSMTTMLIGIIGVVVFFCFCIVAFIFYREKKHAKDKAAQDKKHIHMQDEFSMKNVYRIGAGPSRMSALGSASTNGMYASIKLHKHDSNSEVAEIQGKDSPSMNSSPAVYTQFSNESMAKVRSDAPVLKAPALTMEGGGEIELTPAENTTTGGGFTAIKFDCDDYECEENYLDATAIADTPALQVDLAPSEKIGYSEFQFNPALDTPRPMPSPSANWASTGSSINSDWELARLDTAKSSIANFRMDTDHSSFEPGKKRALPPSASSSFFEPEYSRSTTLSTRRLTKNTSARIWHTKQIPEESLEFFEKVGEGSFGEVWKGEYEGAKVAIKTVKVNKKNVDRGLKLIQEEGKLWASLPSHPNICHLHGFYQRSNGEVGLVTQWVENGSVLDCIEDGVAFNLRQKLSILKQVASALIILHNELLVHRDIALRNVLIDLRTENVKLSDFGMSRQQITAADQSRTATTTLPIAWSAPESLADSIFSISSDVWSFGVLVYEFMEEKMPFEGEPLLRVGMEIASKKRTLPTNPIWPTQIQKLCRWCWKFDPLERPTMKEARNLIQESFREHLKQSSEARNIGLD